MGYAQYTKLEKHIAASDTGSTMERWRYGCRLLKDPEKTTPTGHLKRGKGILAELIAAAARCGVKLSEREIQWRLKCARTYPTEALIRNAVSVYGTWHDLVAANFPSVELPPGVDPGEPYDPRSEREKSWQGMRDSEKRRKAERPGQPPLPGLDLEMPTIFSHDNHSFRTPVRNLLAEAETEAAVAENFSKMAADLSKVAAEKLAYATELAETAAGNLDMSWYEAEARRVGLKQLGLSSWEEFRQITSDFLGPRGADLGLPDPDADEGE